MYDFVCMHERACVHACEVCACEKGSMRGLAKRTCKSECAQVWVRCVQVWVHEVVSTCKYEGVECKCECMWGCVCAIVCACTNACGYLLMRVWLCTCSCVGARIFYELQGTENTIIEKTYIQNCLKLKNTFWYQ